MGRGHHHETVIRILGPLPKFERGEAKHFKFRTEMNVSHKQQQKEHVQNF